MKILITGSSSGLGYSLAKLFLENGNMVYGLSRSQTKLNIEQKICDFNNLKDINKSLFGLIEKNNELDLVFLNASLLGEINTVDKININELKSVFNVNFFANKIILDYLLKYNKPKTVIAISSGAALKAYIGWFSYCTSKCVLNQLIACYAIEYPETKFVSLAPGHIKSKMQDYIFNIDEIKIPSVKKFKDSYHKMDSPDVVAKKIISHLTKIMSLESGSFIDIRDMI